jgi:replicative DNA helicase
VNSAEIAVLGSCLVGDQKAVLDALSVLESEYFDLPIHRDIFDVVQILHKDGKPVDVVTVAESLSPAQRAYLLDLVHHVPSALHVEHYAQIVRKAYFGRELSKAASMAAEEPGDPEAINALKTALKNLEADKHKIKRSAEIASAYVSVTLNDRATNSLRHYKTGFPSLDKSVAFTAGKLMVIGARTSRGKSSIMLRMAYKFLEQRLKVLFVSAEMTADELMDRFNAMETKIDLWKISTEKVKDKEIMGAVTAHSGVIARMPLYVQDEGRVSLASIEADVEAVQPDVVFVDYLQRVHVPASVSSRAAYFSDIANGLKSIAMQKKVLVVAASQLNRDLEHRTDATPTLADFKESGGIEEAADIAVLIAPDEIDDVEKFTGRLLIAKNRNGPCFQLPFVFYKKITRFEEKVENGTETKTEAGTKDDAPAEFFGRGAPND